MADKPRFEVRSTALEFPTWYGIWDKKKNYFLPNAGATGPFVFKDWPIAAVACDLVNSLPRNALDSGEYDGGESWMEEFITTSDPRAADSVLLKHKHCDEFSVDADESHLRDSLQAAYQHLEECGK